MVYGPTDEIISCARIEPWPLLVQEINISFPSEGVKINRYFASVQHGCLFHTAIIIIRVYKIYKLNLFNYKKNYCKLLNCDLRTGII